MIKVGNRLFNDVSNESKKLRAGNHEYKETGNVKEFATYSDFLIPIYLQPNAVDLRYFKL